MCRFFCLGSFVDGLILSFLVFFARIFIPICRVPLDGVDSFCKLGALAPLSKYIIIGKLEIAAMVFV